MPVTYHFAVTNTTDKVQTLESVRTPCACLKVDTGSINNISPGDVLPLDVEFNPAGMEGEVKKHVWVTLAPSKKVVTFEVAADVRLRLGFKPVDVTGLGEDFVAGRPGTLAAGSEFGMDADAFAALAGDGTFKDYLPDGVPVTQTGTKWVVPKGGKVVYAKGTAAVDETKAGANPSALKLSYAAKTGSFKGSFKAYVNSKGKPKSLAANIVGVMVRGIAYGTATIKKLGSLQIWIGD